MPSFVVPDELITTVVEGMDHVEAKLAAMRAHATQITVDGPFFALVQQPGQPGVGTRALPVGPGHGRHGA